MSLFADARLENSLRRFSALTVGDMIEILYNDAVYSVLVMETQPAAGISITETDLQVDFAAPPNYVEPALARRNKTIESSLEIRPEKSQSFLGTGYRLGGSTPAGEDAPPSTVPAAVHLPPNKLYFGFKFPKKEAPADASGTGHLLK